MRRLSQCANDLRQRNVSGLCFGGEAASKFAAITAASTVLADLAGLGPNFTLAVPSFAVASALGIVCINLWEHRVDSSANRAIRAAEHVSSGLYKSDASTWRSPDVDPEAAPTFPSEDHPKTD